MGDYEVALMLLITGMTTVFFILLIVVCIGRISIAILNKFPEKVVEQPTSSTNDRILTQEKFVALTTAVNIATQGRAKVVKIERI
jgi:oxaloacetate decarboxylase gamma subunit